MDNYTCNLVTCHCKNIKSSLDSVREMCDSADVFALQETWLYPSDIAYHFERDE